MLHASASLLHPAEQCWDPSPPQGSISPSRGTAGGRPQLWPAWLLAELNKHSCWHTPDKALFYSAKQCHTPYLTEIRSVAPVVLQSSNLTPDALV